MWAYATFCVVFDVDSKANLCLFICLLICLDRSNVATFCYIFFNFEWELLHFLELGNMRNIRCVVVFFKKCYFSCWLYCSVFNLGWLLYLWFGSTWRISCHPVLWRTTNWRCMCLFYYILFTGMLSLINCMEYLTLIRTVKCWTYGADSFLVLRPRVFNFDATAH